MDAAALWQRYQDWLYYHEGLGLYVDVSRMRFDDAFVAAMQPKFAQAFKDMAALEGGAIANPDENRMVGHYWLRDPDLAPTPALKQEISEALDQLDAFANKIHAGEIRPLRQQNLRIFCRSALAVPLWDQSLLRLRLLLIRHQWQFTF